MTRPYRGISLTSGPRGSYDAVVVGAGVGGLICANLLARAGLSVLLVEQHYVVGGYCSTFRRQGFTFDAASHFYPLLGDQTTITGKLLRDLDVRTEWIKMDPVDQFHLPDGSSFAVSADFETYLADLKGRFPAEATALNKFFALARRLYLLGVLYYFNEKETAWLDDYRRMTVRDALDRFFQSRELKLLLTADCPHWGSPPCRTSFVFDSMLRMSYFLGNYYPRGGSQVFADELAQRFEEQGGHILTKSSVRRIVVRGGRVTAIELETGPKRQRRRATVRCGAVVSNADMRQTVERMVEPGTLDDDYVSWIQSLRPTYPCFLSHIGVEGIPTEVLRRVHGYYWNDWNPDHVGIDSFQFKLFVPTLYEPAMAASGSNQRPRHVIVVQKVTEIDYDTITDWPAHKLTIERFLLDRLERIIPGFEKQIVVCLSASAQTSNRFTLNYQGAMLGWEMSPDQLGDQRPGIDSPIDNLYFAGQWTRPGGGITPVIVSAIRAAERLTGKREVPDLDGDSEFSSVVPQPAAPFVHSEAVR